MKVIRLNRAAGQAPTPQDWVTQALVQGSTVSEAYREYLSDTAPPTARECIRMLFDSTPQQLSEGDTQ